MSRQLIERDNLKIENDTFNNCSVVLGNIYIAKQTILYANYLKNVSGSIILEEGATLNAPKLVFSYGLEINGASATFNAPSYMENRGELSIKGSRTLNIIKNYKSIYVLDNSTLIVPKLRYTNNINIGECATLIAQRLTRISSLYCEMYSCIYAEKLTEISYHLTLSEGSYCKINVEGFCKHVYLHTSVKLNIKEIKELRITGDEDNVVTLPNIESIGDLYIDRGKLITPKLSKLSKANLYLGTLVSTNLHKIYDFIIDGEANIEWTKQLKVESLKIVHKVKNLPACIISIIDLTIQDGVLVIDPKVTIHEIKLLSGTYTYSK